MNSILFSRYKTKNNTELVLVNLIPNSKSQIQNNK